MAQLSANPEGTDLEDFVAAHFVARGVFVEMGVTERDPKDLLELDVVWTDYRSRDAVRHPVEVKSREWQIGELFKFYGWTRYLSLPPGMFVCRQLPSRVSIDTIQRLVGRMGIKLVHVEDPQAVDENFAVLALPSPSEPTLPRLWRFSFWAQRRLLRSLGKAIETNRCPTSARAAKDYLKLINDAVFFEPDVRTRVATLVEAHLGHRWLGKTAANEISGNGVFLEDPPECQAFRDALYCGRYFPVQACLYLAHRARLAILKATVDYVTAKDRNELAHTAEQIFDPVLDVEYFFRPYKAFLQAVDTLSKATHFHLYPVFWQIFLWGWGGFLIEDRKEEEYEALARQTGVPVEEIDTALTAFDLLFPIDGSWFVQPDGDSRRLLKLMPAAMRGIGAFSRLGLYDIEKYEDLGFADDTTRRMVSDHDTGARLLDTSDVGLVS